MAEDLRVQDEQEGEEGGVDPGEHEPGPQQPGQVDQDQHRRCSSIPSRRNASCQAARHEHAQSGQGPALPGGRRVEHGQDQGQGEQAVEGGVPDPPVLVPGVDPALALAVQPAAPLVATSPDRWYERPRRRGSAGRWIGRSAVRLMPSEPGMWSAPHAAPRLRSSAKACAPPTATRELANYGYLTGSLAPTAAGSGPGASSAGTDRTAGITIVKVTRPSADSTSTVPP